MYLYIGTSCWTRILQLAPIIPPPHRCRQNGAVHTLVGLKLVGHEAETLSTALKTQQKATIRRERQREMEERSDGHMCGPETKVDYTCTCDR